MPLATSPLSATCTSACREYRTLRAPPYNEEGQKVLSVVGQLLGKAPHICSLLLVISKTIDRSLEQPERHQPAVASENKK